MAVIPDGGAYAAGYTWSYGAGNYDMYLIRLTDNGDTLWTRTYGDERENGLFDMTVTDNGGAVMVGISSIEATEWPNSNYNYFVSIVRSSPNGDEIWFKNYGGSDEDPYLNDDYGYGVAVCNDGGFVACGLTNSFGTVANAYLIKTDASGQVVGIDEAESVQQGRLYPNPATDLCFYEMPAGFGNATLELTDMVGRRVMSVAVSSSHRTLIRLDRLTTGAYILKAYNESDIISIHKLVKH